MIGDIESGKQRILNEIRRTAEANGGVPLGIARFSQETGIKDSDWKGKIWVRWSDAIRDAGLEPNQLNVAFDDEYLLKKYIQLARALGHLPVWMEVRMKARNDSSFPSPNTFGRFGPKRRLAKTLLEYCKCRDGYENVIELCNTFFEMDERVEPLDAASLSVSLDNLKARYVYLALLKVGREKRYKIGKAVLVERRKDQISVQLPEELELIHAITTDDAFGIEEYWHKRFAAKNTKGEWFSLTRQNIDAFRRRKFM